MIHPEVEAPTDRSVADLDLDLLLGLASRATPGPWQASEFGNGWDLSDPRHFLVARGHNDPSDIQQEISANAEADVTYLAAVSPEVIKGLIERVRTAEALGDPFGLQKVAEMVGQERDAAQDRLAQAEDLLRQMETRMDFCLLCGGDRPFAGRPITHAPDCALAILLRKP